MFKIYRIDHVCGVVFVAEYKTRIEAICEMVRLTTIDPQSFYYLA